MTAGLARRHFSVPRQRPIKVAVEKHLKERPRRSPSTGPFDKLRVPSTVEGLRALSEVETAWPSIQEKKSLFDHGGTRPAQRGTSSVYHALRVVAGVSFFNSHSNLQPQRKD